MATAPAPASPILPSTPAAETPPLPSLAQVEQTVRWARARLRMQGALEGATTASILASAGALGTVFAIRLEMIEGTTGIALIAAAIAVVILGGVFGALRRLDDEEVARRIDRASNLSDRLSTAIAFDRALRGGAPLAAGAEDHAETRDLMRAAIRDAIGAVPRADVRAATPFRRPHDLYSALGFAAIAALAAGIAVPLPPRDPRLLSLDPPAARAGVEVSIIGERLCGAKADATAVCKLDGAMVYIGEGPEAVAAAAGPLGGSLAITGVFAASDTAAIAASVTSWTQRSITFTVPAGARVGKTKVVVWAKDKRYGALDFEVLSKDDARNFKPETVALDPDDEAYMRELVADLKATAKRDDVKDLEDYATKIEKLLDKAENGELTKEQLLQEMKKAEEGLNEHNEPDQNQVDKDLADTGKELQKNELTKELGKALENKDLAKAQQELKQLAEKMDKGQLTEQQQKELSQTLEKVAQDFQKKEDQRQQQQHEQQQQMENEIQKLQKQKDEAKNDQDRQDAERRLQKKQDELRELKKKEEQKDQSAQREALKRLEKNMDKAAKQLQQKPQEGQDKDQQNQDNQKQASKTLKDVADETGKVDQDKRKQAAQQKVSSQMDDLREAMRRAKQRGQNGPNNPFGKNNQKGMQKGQGDGQGDGQGKTGQNGKDGQGKGQGQGQGKDGQGQGKDGQQNGGKGTDKPDGPSNTYGDGHDPNLVGDSTGKSGNDNDESVSGVHGKKGPSRRETILSAAQKGFATTGYRSVYTDYKKIIEEVMKSEKVPSSYRYYVKRYFTKIKPHAMD